MNPQLSEFTKLRQRRAAGESLLRICSFLRRDVVEVWSRIEKVVEYQPQTARMVEKDQREDYREGQPNGELLVDVHAGGSIEQKKPGHGDRNCCGIVDVNRADEITLLALELQAALSASGGHSKWLSIQGADAAARAFEAQAVAEHSYDSQRHFRQELRAASDCAVPTSRWPRHHLNNRAENARCGSVCRL